MSRARLNGIEIDYEVSGRGPAVLLSHGYSAGPAYVRNNVSVLNSEAGIGVEDCRRRGLIREI